MASFCCLHNFCVISGTVLSVFEYFLIIKVRNCAQLLRWCFFSHRGSLYNCCWNLHQLLMELGTASHYNCSKIPRKSLMGKVHVIEWCLIDFLQEVLWFFCDKYELAFWVAVTTYLIQYCHLVLVAASHVLLYAVQGTVIRVFSVPDGQKLFEFRRGVKRWVCQLQVL